MIFMRKLTTVLPALLLAVLMILACVACGGGDENAQTTTAKTTPTPTKSTAPIETPDPDEPEEPIPADLTISTVEEWNDFADKARDYDKCLVKLGGDIDFTDKEFKVIPDAICIIDGDGHTLSGITVNVDAATGGDIGLIANKLSNNTFNGVLTNITIKDSTLTVNVTSGTPNIGIVGKLDRANANKITIDNVTINVTGAANVGLIAGQKAFATSDNDNASAGFEAVGENAPVNSITATKTTINAPDSNVGLLFGDMSECKANAYDINITVKLTALNAADKLLVANIAANATLEQDDTKITINVVDSFS